MKKIAIVLGFIFSISLNAQIVITPGGTAMALAQAIVGPGIAVSNPVLNCGSVSFGMFSTGNVGAGSIGIGNGVLLTTGQAIDVANPESVQADYDSNIPSYIGSNSPDPHLMQIDPNDTINTCKLEFDLVPICPNMKINYVFASEEYPDFVCSVFNDAFGFFISGPGITGVLNIAKIPATNISVAINAINSGTPGIAGLTGCTSLAYSSLFYDNIGGSQIIYGGFTIPLVATATVIPCQTYHLKIAIADALDGAFDSGVFLEQDGITCSNTPTLVTNTSTVVLCAGRSETLTVSGSVNGVNNYTWTPSTGLSTTTGSLVVVNPTVSTTYTVSTPSSCNQIVTQTISVTVVPCGPSIIAQSGTICAGNCFTITTSTTGTLQPYTYLWDNGATTSTLNVCPTVTTIYTVTVTDPNNAIATNTVMVTVNPNPNVSIPSASVCSGVCTTLTATGATNYTWSPSTGLNSISGASVIACPSVTSNYSVIGATAEGCIASTTVGVTVYQAPIVDFTVDDSAGCQTHCVNFKNLTSISGGDSIFKTSWNFGDGINNTQTLAHCYPKVGTYTISLTAISNRGCSASKIKPGYITVFSNPIAAFDPTPKPATIMDPLITFNNQSSSDVIIWHYWFGDGDTVTYRPPNNYNPNPTHLYSDNVEQIYLAGLIVKNSFGCIDTIKHEIIIGPMFTFYIPNTFSPNGDGYNDVFFGKGMGIVTYEIFIFDRWGKQVFEGNSIDAVWDGKSKGGTEFFKQDVYTWKVRLTDVYKKQHHYVGHILLLK